MSEKEGFWIDLDAANMLTYWKSFFASEVTSQARRLAAESNLPNRVTLSHYQKAAHLAIRSLSAVILDGGHSCDDHKAA